MAILDFLRGAPVNGVLRHLQSPLMPQEATPSAAAGARINPVLESPSFGQSLQRLGLNMIAQSAAGQPTLPAFANAALATMDANAGTRQKAFDNRIAQDTLGAQTRKWNADAAAANDPYAALGTGRDSGVIKARAQLYVQQGMTPQDALQAAYSDIVGNEVQTYNDPQRGPVQIKRAPLPPVGGGAAMPSAMSPAGAIGAIAPAWSGMLAPPELAPGSGQAIASALTSNGAPQVSAPLSGLDVVDAAARTEAAKANVQSSMETEKANTKRVKELREQVRLLGDTIGIAGDAFTPTGLPVGAKQAIARVTGAGGQVKDQLVATAQVQSLTPQMLAPMLKPLVGDGPVANAERQAAERVFSDANSTPDERIAVLNRLLNARKSELEHLTGSASDASQPVLRFNPDTGDFD